MKKIILAILGFVPSLVLANPGAYVQAQAGFNIVDSNRNPNGSSDISDQSVKGYAAGLGVGYLWGSGVFNYGLEANILSYPDSTESGIDINGNTLEFKTNGYNLSLLAVLKYTSGCTSGFVTFLKAGGAYVNQQSSVTGSGVAQSETNTKVVPEVDAGFGYQFNPNWEMDFTTNYVISHNSNVANNVNILLGLNYHFA